MIGVILAGGKGTRLHSVTKDEIPKAMVPVQGKAILAHQIETLKSNGVTKVFIICGHLHEKIQDFFGEGSDFGIEIEYFIEETPLGTAGALGYLKEKITSDFFLVFGDLIFDVHLKTMEKFHKEKNALVTLLVHPNNHPYDSDVIILDNDNRVIAIDPKNKKRDYYYKNLVNAGFYLMSPDILDKIPLGEKKDLEKDVLAPLSGSSGRLYGYISPEYIKDVGTPQRLAAAEAHLTQGLVTHKNLGNKQQAVFLDRDGVINRYKGLLSNIDDFALEDGAAEAISLLNSSGYLAIVITNQPVVARNLCTIEDVEEIHKKMETLLGEKGCYLDATYFCPHHPDKGYPEENPLYKIECNCRKPNIGMIERAVEDFNIDLDKSWLIGDTTVDMETGKNAGLKTVLVKTGEGGRDNKYPAQPDLHTKDILEAVEAILMKKGNCI